MSELTKGTSPDQGFTFQTYTCTVCARATTDIHICASCFWCLLLLYSLLQGVVRNQERIQDFRKGGLSVGFSPYGGEWVRYTRRFWKYGLREAFTVHFWHFWLPKGCNLLNPPPETAPGNPHYWFKISNFLLTLILLLPIQWKSPEINKGLMTNDIQRIIFSS